MLFRIPLTWEMYGHVYVEAENMEEAVEIALCPDFPLPDDGEYVDHSVMVDDLVEIEAVE